MMKQAEDTVGELIGRMMSIVKDYMRIDSTSIAAGIPRGSMCNLKICTRLGGATILCQGHDLVFDIMCLSSNS